MTAAELVVLLNDEGEPVGTADKRVVHTAETPLHLGFSCHLVNDAGEVLLTRRALAKLTWPGVWTNSFCGHPAPGEPLEDAVRRRARDELGTTVEAVRLALPDFRYRAVDAGGVVENEVCPVLVARSAAPLDPRADEIAEHAWIPLRALVDAVEAAPFAFSPWLVEELPQLMAIGALDPQEPHGRHDSDDPAAGLDEAPGMPGDPTG